jgi:hypothetical protein
MDDNMIIKEEMKFGLYGQILVWILEILPYLDENNIKPKWDITSPYYGNIFGKHILLNYIPDDSDDIVTLTNIKTNHALHFGNDFQHANKLWNKFFKFSPELLNKVDEYINGLDMKKTIGFHYRGTDKIHTEGGYINTKIFTEIVDDYLKSNNNIDNIVIFTDEKNALIDLKKYYEGNYNIIYSKELYNSNYNDILFSNNIRNNVDVDKHYIDTLNDMIVLSKCSVVFKTASQLSAWPKILNTDIEIYRISSFVHDWFPDSRIPLYKSENNNISILLSNLYKNEAIK